MDGHFIIEQPGPSLFFHYFYIQEAFKLLAIAGLKAFWCEIVILLCCFVCVFSSDSDGYGNCHKERGPPTHLLSTACWGLQGRLMDAALGRCLPKADDTVQQWEGGENAMDWGFGSKERSLSHSNGNKIHWWSWQASIQRLEGAKIYAVTSLNYIHMFRLRVLGCYVVFFPI